MPGSCPTEEMPVCHSKAINHLNNFPIVSHNEKCNCTTYKMRSMNIYPIPHYTEGTDSEIKRKSQFHESLPKSDVNKGPITLTFGRGNTEIYHATLCRHVM